MYKLAAIALAGSILAGCATVGDTRYCPEPVKYTKAQQEQFLRDIPKSPPSVRQIIVPDYQDLRDKARACKEG